MDEKFVSALSKLVNFAPGEIAKFNYMYVRTMYLGLGLNVAYSG